MQRIVIIGNSGSGKSTHARAMAARSIQSRVKGSQGVSSTRSS